MAAQEVMLVNPKKRRKGGSGKKGRPRANPKKRRRARRNPTRAGGGLLRGVNLRDDLRYALWRMGGKLVAAWAVQRFGDPPEANPGGPSPTQGDRWTLKNMAIAWLAGLIGSQIAVRVVGREQAQRVYDGALDLALTKALWTEVVGRVPYGRAMFGQTNGQPMLAQPAAGAPDGDILDDGSGNRWIAQGGKWVAMQGVIEDPIGRLQAESRLGALQAENRLGHVMTPDQAGTPADDFGRRTWRGSADPYAAAYT